MIETNETIDEFLARHAFDVEELVRKAAAKEIVPRWRRLADHEVDLKSGPHDLVTDADRNAELYLTDALAALLPGSVVVGEEAVHANPASYEAIQGEAPVWIVDPVDGTRQFVHGDTGFCTLVALARGGVVHASWTYAPARDQFATAVRGQGAHLDGERLRAGSPEPGRDLRVATSHPDYTTDEQKRALLGLWTDGVAPRACGSAGLEYLALARGESDATAFSWEAAWDHAAGLLLVEEAGGAHLTRAGRPFGIRGGNTLPFTAARDAATARRVVELLAAGA
ncbi:inositol monophosphatase family protein [Streptomyces sp. YIM B13518]|uniref:inositol monophosphatase family protein n=1 Tax=Streptomyces sp. YIM B13518 TaxID=3366316 RepID=UPI00367C9551